MLEINDYVRQSLGLHLFFSRIMKEHSFFLEIGFTNRDKEYIDTANEFRLAFDDILKRVIVLSGNVITSDFLESGEVVTPYTLSAEELSSYYTGIPIDTGITKMELNLGEGTINNIYNMDDTLIRQISELNDFILKLLDALIEFKTSILHNVIACKMFTHNYPHLIEHIIREAKLYKLSVNRLQDKEVINTEAYEQEMFWNNIMAEHSLFARGLLDPTENESIIKANNFANTFNKLYEEAKTAMEQQASLAKVTAESLTATMQIRDFNTQSTEGLINCKVKSIIIPLLSDHVLRESNHYLRLLKKYSI